MSLIHFVLHYAIWCCHCGKALQWRTTMYDIGLMLLRGCRITANGRGSGYALTDM